jgi:hypothetical protein
MHWGRWPDQSFEAVIRDYVRENPEVKLAGVHSQLRLTRY